VEEGPYQIPSIAEIVMEHRLTHRRGGGNLPDYYDATWHYIVREWKHDGPNEYLAIATDGCTDNINTAYQICNSSNRPRHIFDTRQDKIIYRSY